MCLQQSCIFCQTLTNESIRSLVEVAQNFEETNHKMNNQSSYGTKRHTLPLIHCRCGTKILVVPDAAAMGKAIELHVFNCRLTKQAKNLSQCVTDLREYLIEQVLDVAAEAQPVENTNRGSCYRATSWGLR